MDLFGPSHADMRALHNPLSLGPTGFIEAQGTYAHFMGQTADVTAGQLTISSDYVVQGTIETANGGLHVDCRGIIADQLILDKQ